MKLSVQTERPRSQFKVSNSLVSPFKRLNINIDSSRSFNEKTKMLKMKKYFLADKVIFLCRSHSAMKINNLRYKINLYWIRWQRWKPNYRITRYFYFWNLNNLRKSITDYCDKSVTTTQITYLNLFKIKIKNKIENLWLNCWTKRKKKYKIWKKASNTTNFKSINLKTKNFLDNLNQYI